MMAKFQLLVTTIVVTSSLLGAIAHPGETYTVEKLKKTIAARDLAVAHSKRAAQACASNSKHEELQARAGIRRSLAAQILRQKREIVHSMTSSLQNECRFVKLTSMDQSRWYRGGTKKPWMSG